MTAFPCQRDPDLWFSEDPADIEAAKFGCGECKLSVYTACQARGWSHEYGVFGGVSADDRRQEDPLRFARLVKQSAKRAADIDRSRIINQVLAMHAEGVSSQEIGQAVGAKPATVRQWVARAAASEQAA